MASSVAGLDRCFGQVSDQKMTDQAISQRVKTDHGGSVSKAVLHEAVPNGVAHATLRRDTLLKEGKPCCANFEINQQYNLLDENDGYALPTLKISQNSYMPPDAAENMFNITGGVARIKDSTYGQGQNVLAFTMSADVINEVYSYDARTREGSVTLFCQMMQSRTGQFTPDHKHITILWFVNDYEDIVFLHPGGEDHDDVKADQQLQANLTLFWQHTLHIVRKKGGALNAGGTRTRIEEEILPDVVSRAKSTWNESQVVMYFTGASWKEDAPFWKREEGVNSAGNTMYDIRCRELGSFRGESLAKGLVAEWANMEISTTQLPNSETVCYHRGFQVCNQDIEDLCERDKYNDFVAKRLETGLLAGAPFPTEKYSCADFTEDKSALFRFRLHPDADPSVRDYTKGTPASFYELRNAQTNQEAGFIMKSGGFVTYLGRIHGSDQQLSDGELIHLGSFNDIPGTQRPNDLVGGVMNKNSGAQDRQTVVDLCEFLGLKPDAHGNFNEDAEAVIDDIVGGGRKHMGLSVLLAFTQGDENYVARNGTKGVRGGLKSQGITDYFPKLFQYDVLCSVEHDLRMTSSKMQVADESDSHRLLTLRRRSGLDYVLQHDPRFAKYREKMKDPTWVPVEYDNNKRDGKLVGAAGPRRTIGAPLTDTQRTALRVRVTRPQAVRDKHREVNAAWVNDAAVFAPNNIYKYLVEYGCRLAGVKSYEELNQMKLSPNSFVYKIRNLLRHKKGDAMLPPTLRKDIVVLAIRHPQFAMYQLLDAVNNLPRPDTMKDLPGPIEERMRFLEEALAIQAECCKKQLKTSGDKVAHAFKPSASKPKSSSANKKQKTGAGEAGPSGTRKTKVVDMDSDSDGDSEVLEVVAGKQVADEAPELAGLRPASPTWKHTSGPKSYKRSRHIKGKFANQNQEPGESSGSEMSCDDDSGHESEAV